MEMNDFIKNFAGEFEMTDASEITSATHYRELEEWDSLLGLAIIGMINNKYHVKVTGAEIKDGGTVENLYNLVKSRL